MIIPASVDPSVNVPFSVQLVAEAVCISYEESAGGAGNPVLKAKHVPPPRCITSLENTLGTACGCLSGLCQSA